MRRSIFKLTVLFLLSSMPLGCADGGSGGSGGGTDGGASGASTHSNAGQAAPDGSAGDVPGNTADTASVTEVAGGSSGLSESSTAKVQKAGCTVATALNFDPSATSEDGSCIPLVEGCVEQSGASFDLKCIAKHPGCTNPLAANFDPEADGDNGTCKVDVKVAGAAEVAVAASDALEDKVPAPSLDENLASEEVIAETSSEQDVVEEEELAKAPTEEMATDEGQNGCMIQLPVCRNQRIALSSFRDTSAKAHTDAKYCAPRALYYHRLCANLVEDTQTVATFLGGEEGEQRQESTSFCGIEYLRCEKYPNRVASEVIDGNFAASLDEQRCHARAGAYEKLCQNSFSESLEGPLLAQIKTTFYRDGQVVSRDGSDTGCIIRIDHCKNKPALEGGFFDTNLRSKTDALYCQSRAYAFHNSCGNDYANPVVSRFYQNGTLVLEGNTLNACVIDLPSCRLKPTRPTQFLETTKGASQDVAVCMSRASAYASSCGNPYDVVTTARFFEAGKSEPVEQTDTRTGCFVQQDVCRRNAAKAGEWLDLTKNAGIDMERCHRRAREMHRWCGNEFLEVTSASFYEQNSDGAIVKSTKDTKSACVISFDQCQAHPESAKEFLDWSSGADADAEVCKKRAYDIHKWCQNPMEAVVTARFYVDQALVDRGDTTSGCFIEQSTCSRSSAREGGFFDRVGNASSDAKACFYRAIAHHSWCNNTREPITHARFLKDQTVIGQHATDTGCFISQDTCERNAAKVGTFIDLNQASNDGAEACMKRASYYQKWCRNSSSDVTTAQYYKDGQLVSARASNDP